jgi:hypothetical protein
MIRFWEHRQGRPSPCRSRSRARLGIEALEDRRVPAVFNPLPTAADGAASSLRAAVIAANTNGQDNSINLQTGTYMLTIANTSGQENAAAQGDLDLTGAGHTVVIQGAGTTATVVDGGNLDRVFQVFPGVTVLFRNLTIQGGLARDDGTPGTPPTPTVAEGGGVLNAGNTTLDHLLVQGCNAIGANGANGTALSDGGAGAGAQGGGLWNGGSLTVQDSSVLGCDAQGGSGGTGGKGNIFVKGNGGMGGNGAGGAIFTAGPFLLLRGTLAGNQANGGGGGNGDSAGVFGGDGGSGGRALGGGLYVASAATNVNVIDSTISSNQAFGGFGGAGGTSDGMHASGNGGRGGLGLGGGVALDSAMSLLNSTVAFNQAHGGTAGNGGAAIPPTGTAGTAGIPGQGLGGGLDVTAPAIIASTSSLIGDNTASNFGPDVDGAFTSAAYTLLQNAANATGITSGTNGDIVGQDPKLAPLADNGGPTKTHALLPGSAAIDAGSNPMALTVDQRGFGPRGAGAAPDIGAFETSATAGGVTTTLQLIDVQVVRQKRGRRLLEVSDHSTGTLKFSVYPFGQNYRRPWTFQVRDVNGDNVQDVIVTSRLSRKRVEVAIFSGRDGSMLPSNLA